MVRDLHQRPVRATETGSSRSVRAAAGASRLTKRPSCFAPTLRPDGESADAGPEQPLVLLTRAASRAVPRTRRRCLRAQHEGGQARRLGRGPQGPHRGRSRIAVTWPPHAPDISATGCGGQAKQERCRPCCSPCPPREGAEYRRHRAIGRYARAWPTTSSADNSRSDGQNTRSLT